MFIVQSSSQDMPAIRYSEREVCPECGRMCLRTESERAGTTGVRYRYSLSCSECGFTDAEEWW